MKIKDNHENIAPYFDLHEIVEKTALDIYRAKYAENKANYRKGYRNERCLLPESLAHAH
jgi:hypothetical protein